MARHRMCSSLPCFALNEECVNMFLLNHVFYRLESCSITDRSKAMLLLWTFFFAICDSLCPFVCSVSCSCWERADLLALLCMMFSCVLSLSPIRCPGSGVALDCIDS